MFARKLENFPNLRRISTSGNKIDDENFSKILSEVARIYSEFMENHEEEFNICIFHENEQTIVSLFQAAAASAGFLSLTEVAIERKKKNGRSDLWIVANDRQYWIEFKRTSYDPSHRSSGIKASMDAAEKQALDSDYEKLHFGVACVVAAQRECLKGLDRIYEDYAKKCDLSFEIKSKKDLKNYIYFNFVNGTDRT